jgi:putative N6-adenine-specific DNA methylase
MCGSGTIPIEAALIARNIAPGVFRKGFAFEKWADFDQELFDKVYNDDTQEREFTHKIYGYDNNPKANEIATHNVKSAGVAKDIVLKLQPIQQFEQPENESIMITNPPYGERISTNDLLGLYETIGERLKHAFIGGKAWILSYRKECFDSIGLKATDKVPLFNGALECELRKYEIFDGKYKAFKQNEEESGDKRKEERHHERKEFKERPARRFDKGERKDGERPARRFGKSERKEGERPARRGFDGKRDFKPSKERKEKNFDNKRFKHNKDND